MHLIAPLASGIVGAGGGTVELFKRGTATHASYYTDFEAQTSNTTASAPLSLDANGGAVLYVNELVDCVVRASDGTQVREFVAGANASAVEVISDSFTGTDYGNGQSGSSMPTNLKAVLDKWDDSAGADDWKVLFGGVATTIQGALGSLSAYYFNVKSAAYGAIGDGVADDWAAITAATTAAFAAGGGVVFFPAGTYRISLAIQPKSGVSLLGVGAGVSIIKIDDPTSDAISYAFASTSWQSISCLTVAAAQANTGTLVRMRSTNYVAIDRCHLGDGGNARGYGLGMALDCNTATIVRCTDTTFELGTAASYGVRTLSGMPVIIGCRVKPNVGSGTDMLLQDGGIVIGTVFENDLVSGAATRIGIDATTSTNKCLIAGNIFQSTTGSAISPWRLNGAGSGFAEIGNVLGTGYTLLSADIGVGAAASSHEGVWSGAMEKRRYYLASDATPIALPSDLYATLEIVRTTNAAQTLNFADPPGAGILCALVFYNNQGAGSGTITIGGNVKGLASFTVNANNVSYYFFRSVERGTSKYWALAGSTVNVTP